MVSDVSFLFHQITLNPTREIILHEQSMSVSTSWLVLHVQNFMIYCDQVSEFCRMCTLPRFYSTLGSCCFRLLTDFTIGIFRIMSEHIVISSWLETDDSLLPLVSFARVSLTASVTTEGGFVFKRIFLEGVTLAVWVEQDASSSFFNPSVKRSGRSNIVSFFFCSLKVSCGWREFNGWYSLLLGNCYRCDEVSMLPSIYFLLFVNLGVPLDGHEWE